MYINLKFRLINQTILKLNKENIIEFPRPKLAKKDAKTILAKKDAKIISSGP